MGTTEQKLDKIKQTKRRLNAVINSLGGGLTESSKFSDYPLALSQLYSRLPKTTYQEGTNINLGKTLKAVVQYEDDKVMYGDTEQEGTPTPTEPIPISVVTGTQEVVVKGLSEIDFSTYTTKGNTTTYNFSNNIMNITSTGKSQRVIWDILDLVKNNAGKTIRFYYKNVDVSNQYGTSFVRLSITNNGVDTTINLLNHSLVADTYTIPSDVSGITNATFYIFSNAFSSTEYNASVTIEEPMLYFGESDVTSYEPYITPTTYTLHLGDMEFAGIGDYVDDIEFNLDEGKWYKKNNINKLTLNGTENWNDTYTAFGLSELIDKSIASSGGLCNYFIYDNRNSGMSSLTNNKFAIQSISGKTKSSIYIMDTNITGVDNWKTWLSTHNTIVYYPLETPTDEEITDTTLIQDLDNIYSMMSVEGTSIIEVGGNLAGSLKVRAVKGE